VTLSSWSRRTLAANRSCVISFTRNPKDERDQLEADISRVNIVGLRGSLAEHSASLSALRVALEGARDYGAEVQLFDLRELNLPMFVPGLSLFLRSHANCATRCMRRWPRVIESPFHSANREISRSCSEFRRSDLTK
jgi:NADPH-dependent FMN reductase